MKRKYPGTIIAIIVFLGVVGGLGGFTLAKHNENVKKEARQTSQSTVQDNTTNTASDVQRFNNDSFSFEYPKTWVPATGEAGEVVFQSSDYALKELPDAYERGSAYEVQTGYKLTVKVMPADAPNKTIAELTAHIEEEEKTLGGSHKAITVDGNPTLIVNNKHSNQYLYAVIFHEHDQSRVHVQLDAKDDTSTEATELFEKILASFRIN